MKFLLTSFLAILAFTVATPASAGTLSLTPATVSGRVGQSFTFTVTANPQSEANYTVKASVAFTPDVLEVTGFTLDSGWMGLSQPGYDSIDNANGTLIKSAAYPKGFTTPKTFGTITFRVKKAGSATVSVAGSSLMLNASGTNTYAGSSSVAVTVPGIAVNFDTPTPIPAPKPKTSPAVVVALVTATPSFMPTPSPTESIMPSATPNLEVATVGTSFVSGPWFKGLVALAIVVLGGLWLSRRRKNSF